MQHNDMNLRQIMADNCREVCREVCTQIMVDNCVNNCEQFIIEGNPCNIEFES